MEVMNKTSNTTMDLYLSVNTHHLNKLYEHHMNISPFKTLGGKTKHTLQYSECDWSSIFKTLQQYTCKNRYSLSDHIKIHGRHLKAEEGVNKS